MMEQRINDFMAQVEAKNPNEPEFLQAVKEFAVFAKCIILEI